MSRLNDLSVYHCYVYIHLGKYVICKLDKRSYLMKDICIHLFVLDLGRVDIMSFIIFWRWCKNLWRCWQLLNNVNKTNILLVSTLWFWINLDNYIYIYILGDWSLLTEFCCLSFSLFNPSMKKSKKMELLLNIILNQEKMNQV